MRGLWDTYRRNPTPAVRNTLIERHLHIVERIAARLRTRLPSQVEVDDLISAGSFGLSDAIESYDPDRNIRFTTFCQRRIRGAMVDELRTLDWASRTVRSRQARVAEVRRRVQVERGRPATREELISGLGTTEEKFRRIERDAAPVMVTSIDRSCRAGGAEESQVMAIAATAESPLRAAQRKDALELLTRRLSRAERLIVVLYYYEGLTMWEIGLTLDLSESRVSQLHTQILQKLRAQLASRAPELEPLG
ncbi:MAG: FliA/WhiG family RNA polymerase sigma factor [Phycisphaerales bacterium JB039]